MSIAVAILADKNLNRVTQLVTFLNNSGLNVCVHIDAKVTDKNFSKFCNNIPADVAIAKRRKCEWGAFSLVEAELDMCRTIFEKWPDTSHVQLISGDTLPIKKLSDMIELLADQPDTDFIESFAVDDNNWVAGGLGIERFTLTFPFSWKTQRRLFDLWVDAQRKLRIRRSLPEGLTPFIGSQWWCLTRQTIFAILDDPKRDSYDRYFRKCWIPDESYFQTLVRKHARKINSKSLVYSKFDHQGKPTTFYDDHLSSLVELDELFVRKAWDGADQLYKSFLSDGSGIGSISADNIAIGQKIEIASQRRKTGRTGLRMQGREPNRWHEPNIITSQAYDVFAGYDNVTSGFYDWLSNYTSRSNLGHVFANSNIEFPYQEFVGPGGISSSLEIRNVSPRCFLSNLIWQYKKSGLNILLSVDCDQKYQKIIANDRNARIHHVRYAWLFDLMEQHIENEQLLRRRAVELITIENEFLAIFKKPTVKCEFTTRNLADFYRDTHNVFSGIAESQSNRKIKGPILLPKVEDAAPIAEFARNLKDIGVDLDMDKVLGLSQARPNDQAEYIR